MSTKDKLLEAGDLLDNVARSLDSAQTLIIAYTSYNTSPSDYENNELWAIMENLEMNSDKVRRAASLIDCERTGNATA